MLWIPGSVKEKPEAWTKKKERASWGWEENGEHAGVVFAGRLAVRRTVAGCLIATAKGGGGTLWGVGNFSVDLISEKIHELSPADAGRFKSIVFFLQQTGAFIGIYLFAMAADRFGRRPVFVVSFCFAFVSIVAFFWTVQATTIAMRGWRHSCWHRCWGLGRWGRLRGLVFIFRRCFRRDCARRGRGFVITRPDFWRRGRRLRWGIWPCI